jgi:hypothetical protein
VRIVGIDCAIDDTKVGVAWVVKTPSKARTFHALVCTPANSMLEQAARSISDTDGPVLTAIDAPLDGVWPLSTRSRPRATALGPSGNPPARPRFQSGSVSRHRNWQKD